MTTYDKLKDVLHARYIINYDFLRAFFVKNPKYSIILSYLICLEKKWNAEGLFFEADQTYMEKGLKCSRNTIRDAYADFKQKNLIETKASNKGTLVKINQAGIEALYNIYLEKTGSEEGCAIQTTPLINTDQPLINTDQGLCSGLTQLSNKLSKEVSKEDIYIGNPFPKDNHYLKLSYEVLEYFRNKTGNYYSDSEDNNPNLDIIYDRLKDGYTTDQLKQVIDVISNNWKDTEYEQYIRPITLFKKEKIDNYLNSKIIAKNKVENKKPAVNNKAKAEVQKSFDNDAMYAAALKKIKELERKK